MLSACQSAQVSQTHALAHDLANEGMPAVAGMRRQVDLDDADRFCAALYPEVFAAVRAAVTAHSPHIREREVDWATVFTNPRKAMARSNPTNTDGWSDPVLYVQSDALRIFPDSEDLSAVEFSELRGRLEFWEGYVASFDPQAFDPVLLGRAQEEIQALRIRLGVPAP